ncbi:MAG: hypothetical protein KGL39_19955 [Patescibacteria group bacterium]|nr:hypothetical protein [Patescibacteria group bacterium]
MECEIPEFYRVQERKAKKQYPCIECGVDIVPEEKYLYVCGVWDGELSQFRQHLLCARTCEFIRDHIEHECIGFGALFDWLNDYQGQGTERSYFYNADSAHSWAILRVMLAGIYKHGRQIRRRRAL